jgi:formiminotetrahydrofolate cyclodeaminase
MVTGDALAALLGRSLGDTLDDIARQQFPAASGTSSALTAALAAALVAKVARTSRADWDDAGGVIATSEALRTRLSALGASDAEAYARARSLLRRAGQDREHRGAAISPGVAELEGTDRDLELAEALEIAAATPLAIAEAAAELGDLAAQTAQSCGADERADAVVAAVLAEAAASGAASLVLVNLAIREHDDWAVRARVAAASAQAARGRAEATSGP